MSRPLVRLAIYFNHKKRRQFLAPLFTHTHYDVKRTSGAATATEPVRVEIVVIESDDELDSKVSIQRTRGALQMECVAEPALRSHGKPLLLLCRCLSAVRAGSVRCGPIEADRYDDMRPLLE